MTDKIETNTEPGIKVDDIAAYLAYLSFDGVEPVVSDEVKEFSDDLMQKFDAVDGLGYKGVNPFNANGGFYSNRDHDTEIEFAFDDSREAIYSTLGSIVESQFSGCWLDLIFCLLDNVSNVPLRIKVKTRYLGLNYDRLNLCLKDVRDLIDGNMVDDAQLILDLKSELLSQISRSVNKVYFDKYSSRFSA